MKKNLISFLVIMLLILCPITIATASSEAPIIKQGDSGSQVYAIQRKLCELGYLNYRPTGKFSDMTIEAVKKFQQVNQIAPDGQVGNATLEAIFSMDARRNPKNPNFKSKVGVPYTGKNTHKGELSAWEIIDPAFPAGSTVQITDYNSNEKFEVKRVGGENCARVTPVTEQDYDTIAAVFNGETWEHRPMLVIIDGVEYAASMFGMPSHTGVSGSEVMGGYYTLYFNNSKTDVYALADEEHIIAIAEAS